MYEAHINFEDSSQNKNHKIIMYNQMSYVAIYF